MTAICHWNDRSQNGRSPRCEARTFALSAQKDEGGTHVPPSAFCVLLCCLAQRLLVAAAVFTEAEAAAVTRAVLAARSAARRAAWLLRHLHFAGPRHKTRAPYRLFVRHAYALLTRRLARHLTHCLHRVLLRHLLGHAAIGAHGDLHFLDDLVANLLFAHDRLLDAHLDALGHGAVDVDRAMDPDLLGAGFAAGVAAIAAAGAAAIVTATAVAAAIAAAAMTAAAVTAAVAVAAQPRQQTRLGAHGLAFPVPLAHAFLDARRDLLVLPAGLHDAALFIAPFVAADLAAFDRLHGDALDDVANAFAHFADRLAAERVVLDSATFRAVAGPLLLEFLFNALGDGNGSRVWGWRRFGAVSLRAVLGANRDGQRERQRAQQRRAAEQLAGQHDCLLL